MNHIIQSLNMNEAAVLTLEKLSDRMEFEAVSALLDTGTEQKNNECIIVCDIYNWN